MQETGKNGKRSEVESTVLFRASNPSEIAMAIQQHDILHHQHYKMLLQEKRKHLEFPALGAKSAKTSKGGKLNRKKSKRKLTRGKNLSYLWATNRRGT